MGDSGHTATADPQADQRLPIAVLLDSVHALTLDELHQRLGDEGFPELRPGHGCVFRFVDPEGSRLTDLAERAGLTKQAVGEVATDLEAHGYVERVPDPDDGRAKLIRLTERGRSASAAARRIFADIEARWGAELGDRRIAAMRKTLEALSSAQTSM